VLDYTDQYPEAKKQLVQWLIKGKLRRKETIVKGGLAKAEQAFIDLLDGKHTGMLGRTGLDYKLINCHREINNRGFENRRSASRGIKLQTLCQIALEWNR